MRGFFYPALLVILVVALTGLAVASTHRWVVPAAVPVGSYTDPVLIPPGT